MSTSGARPRAGGTALPRQAAARSGWLETADRRDLQAIVAALHDELEGSPSEAASGGLGDLGRELAALGIRADRVAVPAAELALDAERAQARRRIDERLDELTAAGASWPEAVAAFVLEAAQGWGNRLLALRCLESRGLCDEVVVQRGAYGGRSLAHQRLLARRPELGSHEDGGLRVLLREAFAVAAELLPELFEPTSAAVALSPSAAALGRSVALLSGSAEPALRTSDTDALFRAPDALGWAYQFWHGDRRRELLASMRSDRAVKLDGARLLVATQLYTEPYMVRFLVHNSLGALWDALVPGDSSPPPFASRLAEAERPPVEVRPLEELRVLDPACGSGHFLLEAFELLCAMHERAGRLGSPEAIARHVLEHNLVGLELDPRAVQIARAALWMRAADRGLVLRGLRLRLHATDVGAPSERELERRCAQAAADEQLRGAALRVGRALARAAEVGSLLGVEPSLREDVARVRASPLAPGLARGLELLDVLGEPVDVVLGNPPYVDKRDYGDAMRRHVRAELPEGAGNLYAAFLLRALQWRPAALAMVTPQTFLFVRSYERLRERLAQQMSVGLLAQLGTGAFDDAGVDAAMFVLWRQDDGAARQAQRGTYLRLVAARDKAEALAELLRAPTGPGAASLLFRRSFAELSALPGKPWAYHAGPEVLALFQRLPPLRERADVVLGMKTSHNHRFVRAWWELAGTHASIDDERRAAGWVPYEKDVSGRRFATRAQQLVRWTPEAVEHYRRAYSAQLPNPRYWFRRGLAYGLVSQDFTAKLLPAGSMADMAASCIFPHDPADELVLLGLLNSRIARGLLALLNPTVNYQPNDVQRLPVPPLAEPDAAALRLATAAAVDAAAALARLDPTDVDFVPVAWPSRELPAWVDEALGARLRLERAQLQAAAEVDQVAARLYRLGSGASAEGSSDAVSAASALATEAADAVSPPEPDLELGRRIEGCVRSNRQGEMLLERLARCLGTEPLVAAQALGETTGWRGLRFRAEERRTVADALGVVVLRILGHRWPAELASGMAPLPEAVRDGMVVLGAGAGSRSLLERVRALLARQLGGDRLDRTERELGELLGRPLDDWLAEEWFRHHLAAFRLRPLAWQLQSRPSRRGGASAPAFACLLLGTGLDEDTLPKLRSQLLAPCRARCAAELRGATSERQRLALAERSRELEELEAALARVTEHGFACRELEALLAAEPLDAWGARAAAGLAPASRDELAVSERRYAPSLHDGIRVNLAPLELAGLLGARVLTTRDAERALAERARWRAEERAWCRQGLSVRPSWWPD